MPDRAMVTSKTNTEKTGNILRLLKKAGLIVLCIALMVFLLACAFALGSRGKPQGHPRINTVVNLGTEEHSKNIAVGQVRVMTLNLAHGRARGLHQALTSKETILKNLDACATIISREAPQLLAAQEADGVAWWSGSTIQPEYLTKKTNLERYVLGRHVIGLGLEYGTAILSKLKLSDAVCITFDPSPPTPCKGFTVARASVPGIERAQFDFVTVHLDFARESVRRKQVVRMVEVLSKRGGALVVAGDFNCEVTDRDSPVSALVRELGLRVYEPLSREVTFPTLSKRLDYILISPEFEFIGYRTLSDPVSDHNAVVADLRWVGAGNETPGP